MPPKRPKGLKHAAAAEADAPMAKRAKTGDDQAPVFVGADVEESEVAELTALLATATQRVAAGDADQGPTLVRGVLHECTRLLTLEDTESAALTPAERRAVHLCYATALHLHALVTTFASAAAAEDNEEEDAPTTPAAEFLDLAESQIAAAEAIDAEQAAGPTPAAVRVMLRVSRAVVEDDSAALRDVDLKTLGDDEQEVLAWQAQRRLATTQDTDAWANACLALWAQCASDAPRELGTGLNLLAKAEAVVTEQGERAQDDEPVDTSLVRTAKAMLEDAQRALTSALAAEDHPSEQHFVPLAEVAVQLGTAAELLDEDNPTVLGYYEKAMDHFTKAQQYDTDAVDPEVLEGVQATVDAIKADMSVAA